MGQGKKSHYTRKVQSMCNECDAPLIERDVITHLISEHCESLFYKCHLCRNYSGYRSSSLFQHQKYKHEVRHYILACPICMKFFSPQEKDIMTHLVKVHSRLEKVMVCNYCNFQSKFDLEAHFKEVHSRYVCVNYGCQIVCKNSMDLFEHYVVNHFPTLTLWYKCSKCDREFATRNSLYQHKSAKCGIVEDEEEETFIKFCCQNCSLTTNNKTNYQQHSTKKHPDHFFNCAYQNCNYQTKLFWSLTQHTIDKHLSIEFFKYDCYECEEEEEEGVLYSTFKVHSLMQHLRDKHSIVDTCSLCNTYEDDLSDHISSDPDHSYVIYKCTICNLGYEEKTELVDHLSDDHFSISSLLKRLCYGN